MASAIKVRNAASVFLDLAEEHLDLSAQFIHGLVVDDGSFAVFTTRDNRDVVVGFECAAVGIAVVAHVLDDIATEDRRRQFTRLRNIGHVAARQKPLDHMIFCGDCQMERCRHAGAVDTSGPGPPFAPPPWR